MNQSNYPCAEAGTPAISAETTLTPPAARVATLQTRLADLAASTLMAAIRFVSVPWGVQAALVVCTALAACGGGGGGGGGDEPIAAEPMCQPLSQNQTSIVQSLNQFWGKSVKLCQVPGSQPTLNPATGVFIVDPAMLNFGAQEYGSDAVIGVLAEVWAWFAQGARGPGLANELQEVCMAGAYLRWAKLSDAGYIKFTLDPVDGESPSTAQQRARAIQRGYAYSANVY